MNWKTRLCDDDTSRWLGDAVGIELEASGLRALALGMVKACDSPAGAARVLFEHVAQLPFAVTDLDTRCDPRLLAHSHQGDAFSKATLWVHLLRLVQIPARMRWVQLESTLLTRGLWDFVRLTGQAFVYPLTEVCIDGRWLCTDAYILDAPLLAAVHHRLDRQGWNSGYLAHRTGTAHWDASADTHQRFAAEDPGSMQLQDLGCAHSFEDFIQRSPQHYMNTAAFRLAYASQANLMNQELEHMRLMA